MIDTIVLTLYNGQFMPMIGIAQFNPPLSKIVNRDKTVESCVQNPRSHDKKMGIYKPRLTLTKRPRKKYRTGIEYSLRIEFSIPKLLFKNNFCEVSDADLNEVLYQLQQVLLDMGIETTTKNLERAQVSAIHYGKNIVLDDFELPSAYIEEISKANVSRIYDVNRSDFRNEGHSYKFRTNNFEFTLYDKLKDLQQAKLSPKRSVEKDKFVQDGLFDLLENKNENPFEVLRLEIRLNKRRLIKKELNRLGYTFELEDLTFKNLFLSDIAKKVCLGRLHEVKRGLNTTTGQKNDSITTKITQLLSVNPDQTPRLIFEYSAYDEVVIEHDVRTARQLIDPKNKNWFNIKTRFEGIQKDTNSYKSKVDHLIEKVQQFKTVRLNDYPQLKLDNVN